ncbi:MAG: hypothetical protein GH143_00270 [Calditrichaeota bacterium]|nr:hypothetical protein [Calditrichota bacterium]
MDLKDKLDLLWKYLFLAVILAFVILLFVSRAGYRDHFPRAFVGRPHMGMRFISEDFMGMGHGKEIKVVKKVTNGDTTVVVWVDGKQVDNPEEYLKKIKLEGESGDIHIMKWKDEHGKKMEIRVKVEKEKD